MAAATSVQSFLHEAGVSSKRPAPAAASAEDGASKRRLLLPITLHLELGAKEVKEQLLWRLGDAKAVPALVARAFASQHVQQPQQLEREATRLRKELEKCVEQHRDLVAASAPAAPTLVQLQLRVPLPHLGGAVFADDPLWDLSAPRTACEAYITAVCSDLRLDWQAHTLIMRQMKDGIDAAAQGLASGRTPVVAPPADVARAQPSQLPRVLLAQEQVPADLAKPGEEVADAAAAAAGSEEDMPDLPDERE